MVESPTVAMVTMVTVWFDRDECQGIDKGNSGYVWFLVLKLMVSQWN